MTTICGGGTSAPKAGVAAVVDYSSGLIASILAARGAGWLIPVIPLAAFPPLVLSTFCSTDPPVVPTFTSAETTALTQLQFGSDFDSGLSKLKDLILHSIWYDACQCTSGSLTTFPTITPPAGTPIFVPPPAPVNSAPCATVSGSDTRSLPVGAGYSSVNLVGQGACTGGYLGNGFFLPQGASWLRATFTNTVSGAGPTDTFSFVTRFASGTVHTAAGVGATTGGFDTSVVSGATVVVDFAIPVGSDRVYCCNTFTAHGNTTNVSSVTLDIYCGGPPGSTQQPCCPPDQATQSYLDLILQMVTLIQRQIAPFAYVPGASHSGLSGNSQFAVSGILGLSVSLTTVPSQLGVESGDPDTIFEAGWVTVGTAEGWHKSVRIDHNPTLILPVDGAETLVGYTFHPGVVATILELVREP